MEHQMILHQKRKLQMKTFKEYLQERLSDDEVADLERRKERHKRSSERKKENLATRKARYKDSP